MPSGSGPRRANDVGVPLPGQSLGIMAGGLLMGWWSRLFGRRGSQAAGEHAVIVSFDYGLADLEPLLTLGERLRETVEAAGTGEYDGHEVAENGSDGMFFLYGPDADRLLGSIRPVLLSSGLLKRARARLRYGEVGRNAPETVLEIG